MAETVAPPARAEGVADEPLHASGIVPARTDRSPRGRRGRIWARGGRAVTPQSRRSGLRSPHLRLRRVRRKTHSGRDGKNHGATNTDWARPVLVRHPECLCVDVGRQSVELAVLERYVWLSFNTATEMERELSNVRMVGRPVWHTRIMASWSSWNTTGP